MSPSPPGSPVMGASHRIDRHQSASPPQQQLSKRDKRRTMLAERLAEMTAQFSSNRDIHYREQLQALQIDMNLIMEADAIIGKDPLVNDPAGVDALVRENMAKTGMKSAGGNPPPRAGRIYADFAKGINDVMEERDANLATHKRNYEVRMNELNSAHAYRMKLATTEYKALSNTLRDRLINSVTSKKNRLSRDKETIEIGESNALLLHPSQFGIANPASPGGLHGKRATRHRRDADELLNFTETNKRKRKAGDSDESPAPTRQRVDGTSTPLWFADKQATIAKQIDTPLYSIDKLFTEKELSMTYNAAALAAHSHMQRHPPFADDDESPQNGKSDSSSENEKTTTAAAEGEAEDAESPPGGAMMERQYSHATRSTRGTANYITGLGIDAISDINLAGNLQALTRQIPKLPPFLAYGSLKVYAKGEPVNSPAALPPDDVAAELELIRRARNYNDDKGLGKNLELDNGGKPLLEMASYPRTFSYWVGSENKSSLGKSREEREREREREDEREGRLGGDRFGGGGVDMERGDSRVSAAGSDVGGMSAMAMAMGGTPMSRQGTGDGVTSSKGRKITRREVN